MSIRYFPPAPAYTVNRGKSRVEHVSSRVHHNNLVLFITLSVPHLIPTAAPCLLRKVTMDGIMRVLQQTTRDAGTALMGAGCWEVQKNEPACQRRMGARVCLFRVTAGDPAAVGYRVHVQQIFDLYWECSGRRTGIFGTR